MNVCVSVSVCVCVCVCCECRAASCHPKAPVTLVCPQQAPPARNLSRSCGPSHLSRVTENCTAFISSSSSSDSDELAGKLGAELRVSKVKHTHRRRGEEPRDKVYSSQDNITNIWNICIICLYWKNLINAVQTHDLSLSHTHGCTRGLIH